MGLWRAIVWGFGATLGSRAADKTIAEAGEALEPEDPGGAKTARKGRDEEKLMAEGMEARRRRAEARRNRDIDKELALLKRKIAERDRR
jgi:hypothetical protein